MGELTAFSARQIIIHGSNLCQTVVSPNSRKMSVENASPNCWASVFSELSIKDEKVCRIPAEQALAAGQLVFPFGCVSPGGWTNKKTDSEVNTVGFLFFQFLTTSQVSDKVSDLAGPPMIDRRWPNRLRIRRRLSGRFVASGTWDSFIPFFNQRILGELKDLTDIEPQVFLTAVHNGGNGKPLHPFEDRLFRQKGG